MREIPFLQFDYRKYKKTPYYVNPDPLRDSEVAAQKNKMEQQLRKYKYSEDFDRCTHTSFNNRTSIDQMVTLTVLSSLVFSKILMGAFYKNYYTKKHFLIGYLKGLVFMGALSYFVHYRDQHNRVYQRAPYGRLSYPLVNFKHMSYQYNLFQDVPLIKQKYSDKDYNLFKDPMDQAQKRKLEKMYPYFVRYLREHPQSLY